MHDEERMLAAIGVPDIESLFSDIPSSVRKEIQGLPDPLAEHDLYLEMLSIMNKNTSTSEYSCFLGGGLVDNYIPASVPSLVGRSEFYTSYTPYQPEASQGILQSIFEYQSLVAELVGMEVVNSSLYDWSTALGEASLLAMSATRRKEIIIPEAIHWEKESVLKTYLQGHGGIIRKAGFNKETGMIDIDALLAMVNENTAAVYIENPNLFGVFEESVLELKEKLGKTLLIVGANMLSLPLIKPPGEYGADIVIGEGQNLGLSLAYGGPYLGIFACSKKLSRRAPGRLVGITEDSHGDRAYCVTLQTREQHIRREKATSNICTNQSLCALQAAVYMSVLGSTGLRNLAVELMDKSHSLAQKISKIHGYEAPMFSGSFFNEFTVKHPEPVEEINARLKQEKIIGALSIAQMFPELGNAGIYGVSNKNCWGNIDSLVNALGGTEPGRCIQ